MEQSIDTCNMLYIIINHNAHSSHSSLHKRYIYIFKLIDFCVQILTKCIPVIPHLSLTVITECMYI